MSPRALLFSSDQETSTSLRQALESLELEVVHCREIFAAVEQVTSRSFGVIVCDWDDGVEASFLLKTSRELNSTRNAVTVAILAATNTPRPAGADLVLTKPVIAETAKYTLLNSDAFLAGLRTWLPELLARETRPQAINPKTSEGLGGISGYRVDYGNELNLFMPYRELRRSRRWTQRSMMLPAATLLFICSLIYLGTEPLRGDVGSRLMDNAWLHVAGAMTSHGTHPTAVSGDVNSLRNRPAGRELTQHIRVIPVRATAQPPQSAKPVTELEVSSVQTQLPVMTKPAIPESLKTPIASGGSSNAPVVSTIFSSLQPVILPAEVSRDLLLEAVQPHYPEQALKAGLDGPVTFLASIGRDGRVEELKLVRGYLVLADSAYRAVKQWRYKPYVLNGHAVEAQTYVTVDFRRR
jgi:TonB family protein